MEIQNVLHMLIHLIHILTQGVLYVLHTLTHSPRQTDTHTATHTSPAPQRRHQQTETSSRQARGRGTPSVPPIDTPTNTLILCMTCFIDGVVYVDSLCVGVEKS
eukprot:GHVQ01015057.1.p2 GENE.GHVQ01015057.1~~GHVQ01015057.1.p2  ORF type:complete len:104 (+),score=14.94 GHVQ01015057.1:551-862(+)